MTGDYATEKLGILCEQLSSASSEVDRRSAWPAEQIRWLSEADVFRWFVPESYGGLGWTEEQILDGYLSLSRSCLTTTFILTQWNAACKRIISSENEALKASLLPAMASGTTFATVGISHLTTSRQHLAKPVLAAEPSRHGYVLNGLSPWVTGAAAADVLVLGAVLEDGNQILCAVPKESAGLKANPGAELVALTSSCTDQVDLDGVYIAADHLLAGPTKNVLASSSGGSAGGLQTSTLAVGLALAAAEYLIDQASKRPDLTSVAEKIMADCQELRAVLHALTTGQPCNSNASDLRQRANSLVLRSTQAALSAAKGAGFVASHSTGRWAREALFFLVWSCPQPVVNANLCELAQLS